jgi:hypothetical protein
MSISNKIPTIPDISALIRFYHLMQQENQTPNSSQSISTINTNTNLSTPPSPPGFTEQPNTEINPHVTTNSNVTSTSSVLTFPPSPPGFTTGMHAGTSPAEPLLQALTQTEHQNTQKIMSSNATQTPPASSPILTPKNDAHPESIHEGTIQHHKTSPSVSANSVESLDHEKGITINFYNTPDPKASEKNGITINFFGYNANGGGSQATQPRGVTINFHT